MSQRFYVWLIPVGKDADGNDVQYDGVQAEDHSAYIEIEL
jgi:hypothetical protein